MAMEDRHPMTGNKMTDEPAPEGHGFEEHEYDVSARRSPPTTPAHASRSCASRCSARRTP
jgi:hypothetical protein